MSRNELPSSETLTFDKWFQDWTTQFKNLTSKEAKKALEELEKLVDDYFTK
jgi:hypothetical protein